MSITHFTDAVEIEGSQDTTQLKVQGHSSQTEPLQSWEDSAGSPLSHITADGRLLVGDDPGLEAPDALVEAHRDITSVSVPQRALNTLGRVTGALGTAVQWVVHELELRGTGGISGLHTALRSRLIHADTGDSSDSELRAGDFETINQTGTTSERVGKAVALSAAVTNQAGAHLNTATGVEISLQNGDGGSISEAYGLKINDLNPSTATNSYALHTGTGVVRFGDAVAINKDQPHASAILDIESTSQGVLLPRMLETERDYNIDLPETGLIIFNTDTKKLNVYDGSSWVEVGGGSVDWSAPGAIGSGVPNSGAFTTLTTTGNAGIGTSATSLRLSVAGGISADDQIWSSRPGNHWASPI